jgi:HAD superfamily hydrolase (TIGR01509 family)
MKHINHETSGKDQTAISRDLVVLDVGGVLFTDIETNLKQALTQATACNKEAVFSAFGSMEEDLWCGLISTEQFWHTLGSKLRHHFDSQFWDEACVELQAPLLSQQSLDNLIENCDVALLTNHRTEWLFPRLNRAGLNNTFSPIVVSAIVGRMKPDPRIYETMQNKLSRDYDRRLFIDDRPINLQPAVELGYQVINADPRHDWESTLTEWLQN